DILQAFEFADDLRRTRRGALTGMRIGAVSTLGAHRKFEPQRAFFAEAQCPRAARLAAQAAVAKDFRVVIRQVASAVGPESLFVRHSRQRQPAMKLGAHFTQVQEGEDRSSGTAFHVAGATPVDPAVDEFTAPWVVRPAGGVTHREDVDMAVEREVTSRLSGVE